MSEKIEYKTCEWLNSIARNVKSRQKYKTYMLYFIEHPLMAFVVCLSILAVSFTEVK